MAQARTLTEFQDSLDKEMSWRVKEIGVFNIASRKNGPNNKSFIRAGIALTYAHWEGFIKSSSEIYLKHVSYQNVKYSELNTCFAVFGLKGRLNDLTESNSAKATATAFEFIASKMDEAANFGASTTINTQSNLSSKVFANIANSLAIDTTPYDTRYNLIDKSLLDQRNAIAHGEHINIAGPDFTTLTVEVLDLMRQYKTDLENAASLQTYRRPTSP